MVADAWGGPGAEAEEQTHWFTRALEAQRAGTFLWSPVALTIGIWTYFSLATEPGWLVAAPPAIAALFLLALRRHSGATALMALVALGFFLAKARTEWVATPLLHATTDEVAINGTVEDVSLSGKRRILILEVGSIEGIEKTDQPRKLRLYATSRQDAPRTGDRIAAKARLAPVPGPVIPGGFDYGRQLFFEGIGGTGRIATPMRIEAGGASWRLSLLRLLDDTRATINLQINAVLDGDTAAFAEALIDGERGTIPKDLNTSFQISGLAHVLSISGLHMSLVAGGVFWLVRAILALFPPLALRWPIKKFAATAALAAGLFYMLLAGSEVATQRSYIMIAVVFFAILVDRPALSLRNLALAALIILGLEPEAAIQASFQMSFLAVMGLAAFFEAWARWRRTRNEELRERQSMPIRIARKIATIALASLATTLVAGLMSSIPAAYHFGRIAPYGLIGNGLGIPVISFVVMPMGLVATLLMPLGLEYWPLWLMGWGLDLTMAISDWVAKLPGAKMVLPQQPVEAAMLTAFGAVMLCLLQGRVRLAGVAVMIAGATLASLRTEPDILINRTASNVALRDSGGLLVPLSGRKDRFGVEKWLAANGEEATPAEAAKRQGWSCADNRCVAAIKGHGIAYLTEGSALPQACAGIDILIAEFPLRENCKNVKIRIDRFDVWRNGAQALYISDHVTIETARGEQGDRPWVVVPKPRATKFKPQSQRLFDTFQATAIRGKSQP